MYSTASDLGRPRLTAVPVPGLISVRLHRPQFLVELTLVQYPICNKYVSSVQAASALCVARFCCGHVPWTPALERLTG